MTCLALVLCLAACHAASPALPLPAAVSTAVAPPRRPLLRTYDLGARGSLTLGQPRALADGHVAPYDRGVTLCDGRCPDTIVAFDPPLPEGVAALKVTLDATGRITAIVGVYEPLLPLSKVRALWEARLGESPCGVHPRQLHWRDAATLVLIVADSAGDAHLWSMADMTRTDLGPTSSYACP